MLPPCFRSFFIMSQAQKDILIINDFRQNVYIFLKNRKFIVKVLQM